ncbi:serine carboxypeptidase S28 [Colletotrichum graminicola]|uniref:Serine carboxypeptidase S28 n=1 Tax=Colletotrichum graminicola (strain M1.001 / M2 / FGSC 10212) TaxID=645133 RepID=E3QVM1_COLGM|nr:serine carboxypeptidase S28 [Colletotrichum graminicola M1.001]EFQ34909.1 serine carboxypeptidase S28 [Colletotrichum graminicola M1.001]WDK12887.1 serine carboxypeptidase S28 [Colletotrichum graminicola]
MAAHWKLRACMLLGAAQAAAGLGPQHRLMNREAWDAIHSTPQLQVESVSTFSKYPEYNLSVPIDHFHNDSRYEPHSDEYFNLRYWFDAKHYRPGGPVIILAAGETDGKDRLPFLDHGILSILAKATGGVGVVLEHRYYGKSFPVPDLSTENLRFLSTDQALADTVYFAKHISFPGHEDLNLTAPGTPYLVYGGSYAGAFAAFLRKLYPDVFWGGISSSGVTAAIIDYWEYYEGARLFAPGDCAETTQNLTQVVDNVLLAKSEQVKPSHVSQLKELFGLGPLQDDDFASTISYGISGLQSTNWDPASDSTSFGTYCATVSSDSVLFGSTRHLRPAVEELLFVSGADVKLTNRLLNYAGYVRNYVKKGCRGGDLVKCFSSRKREGYQNISVHQGYERSWFYQVCTEWGYFQTGSGVPEDQLPLVSRVIDVEYSSIYCREAFNITKPPNVDAINKHGGFNFSYPRVAIVDGEADPWRPATPHKIGLDRKSTTSEPFLLIELGVHHWDENGVKPENVTPDFPPASIKKVQAQEVEFVTAWMKEWRDAQSQSNRQEEPVFEEL